MMQGAFGQNPRYVTMLERPKPCTTARDRTASRADRKYRRAKLAALAAACLPLAAFATSPTPPVRVDDARLLNAENDSANWLSYGGGYSEQRYSKLSQINTQNVSRLAPA